MKNLFSARGQSRAQRQNRRRGLRPARAALARFFAKPAFTRDVLASKRGSALMMAIFTVTMLLVIATEVIYQTSVEYLISSQGVRGVEAYYAAKAGAEISLLRIHIYLKAIAQFGNSLPNKSMLDPIWNIPFAWPPVLPKEASGVDRDQINTAVKASGMKAQYLATIEAETGKIDVNDLASSSLALAKAARAQLAQTLQAKIDSDAEFAEEFRGYDFNKLFDAVKFYAGESKDDPGGLLGAYGSRASDFMPPHRPLKTIQELHLIPGMSDKIFDALFPRITVYGAKGVNVNYADKEVLMSLNPQITADRAQRIVDARNDPNRGPFKDIKDFVAFLNQLGISGDPFSGDKDPATGQELPPAIFFDPEMNFRVRSTGMSGKVTREVVAIVYDFDRVKARWAALNPSPSASPQTAPVASGSSGAAGQPAALATPQPSPSSTPAMKVPNARPNVVYWSES
jgi:general secretion pathway protein K